MKALVLWFILAICTTLVYSSERYCNHQSGIVCGENGKTYRNECQAKRRNIAIKCNKECPCPEPCVLPGAYNPICGSNIYQCSTNCRIKKNLEKYEVIYKHYPGKCVKVNGIDGGSEDVTTLPDGLTFISSGLYPEGKPAIYILNRNSPNNHVTELTILKNIPGFRPHGISVWTEEHSDIITLMVVSHGVEETVEIFEYKRGMLTLQHVKTVATGGIHMNDIVAVGRYYFYCVQDVQNLADLDLTIQEAYGLVHLGKVWFFNGAEFKVVLGGLALPSGINISPDYKYIYVPQLVAQNILTCTIRSDGNLDIIQETYVDTLPDNIEVDSVTGDLWIGCSPRFDKLLEYLFVTNRTSLSPSQVLKISTVNGLPSSDITEVFLDDGTFISTSSVASFYKDKVLIGTVTSQLALCDVHS